MDINGKVVAWAIESHKNRNRIFKEMELEITENYGCNRAWGIHLVTLCHSPCDHGILKNTPNFTRYWPKIILLKRV